MQVWLAASVALAAGVIATILFFQATGMVRDNPVALGAAEAMQGAELLFATAIGVAFLHEAWPRGIAVWGAVLVVLGIVAFAILVGRRSAGSLPRTRALRPDRGACTTIPAPSKRAKPRRDRKSVGTEKRVS